jgi:hypothetical protein
MLHFRAPLGEFVMLVIRNEQMDAFRASLRDQHVRGLTDRMRSRFGTKFAAMAEPDLRKWVEKGLAKARRYGYSRQSDAQLFIDLCAECGLDFDLKPWAAAILANARFTSGEKLARVQAHVVFALRDF